MPYPLITRTLIKGTLHNPWSLKTSRGSEPTSQRQSLESQCGRSSPRAAANPPVGLEGLDQHLDHCQPGAGPTDGLTRARRASKSPFAAGISGTLFLDGMSGIKFPEIQIAIFQRGASPTAFEGQLC